MYRDLAWTWPIISPPEDYLSEADMLRSAIESESRIPVRTALNMGCGGGHIDFHLKARYTITGVDISRGMLENAIGLNPEVEYVLGDMRSVRLGRQFDSVLVGDSLMYMLDETDLLSAFETAFAHLKPGGVFCTYVEELPGRFRPDTFIHEAKSKGGKEITLIEHKWCPDPGGNSFELVFIYIIKESGMVRVEVDKHKCGMFPLVRWKALLAQAGFAVKSTKDPQPGIVHLLVCRKPSE